MKLLVLNSGSSSIKCWYHDFGNQPWPLEAPEPLWKQTLSLSSRDELPTVLANILRQVPGSVDAVGHRVVHGGQFHESSLLTPEVRAEIQRQTEIAPLHASAGLAAVEAVDLAYGSGIPQIAVFDTAFHTTLPEEAYVYPGPHAWLADGIRRYGFHGISHRYSARRAAELLGPGKALRIITSHLGGGASLAAVKDGKCVDTTMGFTPLEGLMMGSRSGSVDPGILIYLLRHKGMNLEQLEDVLQRKSGLLGLSGVSADMREVLAAIEQGNERARLAFDVYVHRLVRETGAMLAVLGGVDAVVFTGGIGENCPPVREALARQLTFCGLHLDALRNASLEEDGDIATPDSRVRALVIRTQEEWEIAQECGRVMRQIDKRKMD